jgi:sigma-E factor negative regulatory protein RseC
LTQFAIIKKLMPAGKAEVEVLRGTACGDSCGSCEVCNYASKLRVEAKNPIYAQVGDRVEIETASSKVLGAAFLVYVVPFILFFIGYAVAHALGASQGWCVTVSFLAFACGLGIAVLVARSKKKSPITYEIIRIIGHGDE